MFGFVVCFSNFSRLSVSLLYQPWPSSRALFPEIHRIPSESFHVCPIHGRATAQRYQANSGQRLCLHSSDQQLPDTTAQRFRLVMAASPALLAFVIDFSPGWSCLRWFRQFTFTSASRIELASQRKSSLMVWANCVEVDAPGIMPISAYLA